MLGNYPDSLKAVLRSEGGYSNNPLDPGGATNFGITQKTYDAWNDAKGHARQSVRFIGLDEVSAIYKSEYWDVVHGDVLPPGLDYVVFDYAVNSGPKRAMGAYAATPTIDGICDGRLAFLKSLSTWPTFGNGWTNRVASVRALGKAMALHAAIPTTAPQAPIPVPPHADTPQAAKPLPASPVGPLAAFIQLISFIITTMFARKATK